MKILRFQPDRPIELALSSPKGTLVEGRYGDRVMFHLTDGRVMYVPPIVAGKIEAQGITAGEWFELCRAQIRTGQRRTVEWRLKRSDSGQPHDKPGSAAQVNQEADTALESQLRRSLELVAGNAPKQQPSDRAPSAQVSAAPSNGNGHASDPSPASPSSPTTKLEHALRTAISAAYNAEKFGADLGYVVRFDADAIKSMAITVLINMREESR